MLPRDRYTAEQLLGGLVGQRDRPEQLARRDPLGVEPRDELGDPLVMRPTVSQPTCRGRGLLLTSQPTLLVP